MRKSWAVLVLVLVSVSGCGIYFGDDDDDPPPCNYGYDTNVKPGAPAQELRDPNTGQCSYYGGDYPCDDVCGPCPAIGIAQPDYGSCYSACEGLSETACIATEGCFAAYIDDPGDDGTNDFYGCWQTAPSGPVHGTCVGNSAQECSRHDDCSAVYVNNFDNANSPLQFSQCVAEPPPGSCDAMCPTGYHCEEACTGELSCTTSCVQDLTCAAVDCGPGYTCAEVCEVGGNGISTCHPTCVVSQACEAVTTEQACQLRSDCTPVYDGQNCTCTLSGCSCEVLTYERCQTL